MHDDLEIHLRAMRRRSVPPSWRREILAACATPSREPRVRRLARFLQPDPVPLTVLVVLWLVILGFFLNTPADPPVLPGHMNAVALREARHEREMILAQINGIDREEPRGVFFSRPLQRREGHP